MKINHKLRLQLLMQHSMFVVLFLAVVGLLGYFFSLHPVSRDVTQASRNMLTQGSVNLLKALPGDVNIQVFVSKNHEYRKTIHDFLSRYQRVKPDIHVEYINPAEFPKKAQEASISNEGELVVEYQKRTEHLTPPYAEQEMVNVLSRLAKSHSRSVMFLDGHGERSLVGEKNHDLGEFGFQLGKKGFKLSNPDLTVLDKVPSGGAMLVIAAPQVDISPMEVRKIMNYVEQGGNLLWFIDQGSLHKLDQLASYLGLILTPGMVHDEAAALYGADPRIAFAGQYGEHAITHDFNLRTLFPEARMVEASEATRNQGWQVARLVEVATKGWLETGKNDKAATFDPKKGDIVGPVNVAIALERKAQDRTQRVVVVGGGGFLSNTFVSNPANFDLGVNIVNWLSHDDKLITIQPKPLKDINIVIPTDSWNRFLAMSVFHGYRFALPLIFLMAGLVIWLRRRRR